VIEGVTDRVYIPANWKNIVDVTVGIGDGKSLKMTSSGMCGKKIVPVSLFCMEKAEGMSDFGNDEYHYMICVEPGILNNIASLEAG